jgi:hypothetical protein
MAIVSLQRNKSRKLSNLQHLQKYAGKTKRRE